MKTIKIFFSLLVLLGFACNNSNTKSHDSTTAADSIDSDVQKFMTEAASGGMMEIELGKIAESQALHPRVKAFGAMLVADHTKASEELKTLAASKNISLPEAVSADHQKHIDELKALSGADFDKAYIKMMLKDHRKDINNFEDASMDAGDTDVKAFAAKTLPVLKAHLDSAKAINRAVKGSLNPEDLSDGVETFPQR